MTIGKTAIISSLLLVSFSAFSASPADSTAASRLTIGGYGEATVTHGFYSNNPYRYMYPDRFTASNGFSQVDLPHVVVMMGYDFGSGWTMGTEIEFEHGGVEAAIEVEGDEAIEVEHEIERGGEVYLEQFWLQKSWSKAANLRAGMIIVPIGLTNNRHEPDGFFTVFRQEAESTILPCTWHQIGLSFWGRTGDWRYEAQLLPGLNSRFFNNSGWIAGGSASPYEYTVANEPAGALRLDNYSLKGMRVGLSAYAGGTYNDAYPNSSSTNAVRGIAYVAALDFEFKSAHVIARGNFDYGYLANAANIGTSNKNSDNSTFSPYQHTFVGEQAWAFGHEVGFDVLSYGANAHGRQLFVFGRLDRFDSFVPAAGQTDYLWADRTVYSLGINYRPIPQIIVKAQASYAKMARKNDGTPEYNPEPAISLGITYAGFFKK